jgi:hypothetical protein
MIDKSVIYRNPLIPEDGYFYVQVLNVDMDNVPNSDHPRIFVRVQLHPDYGYGDNVTLASIIHPSEKCKYQRMNFLNTFLILNENHIQQALGKWGSVEIYQTEYMETKYSAIKWVYQPIPIRLECARMNQEQQQGRLPKLPCNDPPPKPKVEMIDMSKGWGSIQEMSMALVNAKLEAKWKKRFPNIPYPRIPEMEISV